MRGGDRQSISIGQADGHHGGDLCCGTLCVCQVTLTDLLPDGDDDALPTHHRSKPESESYSNLYPRRYELGRLIEKLLVVGHDLGVVFAELGPKLRKQTDGLAG